MINQLYAEKARIQGTGNQNNEILQQARKEMNKRLDYDQNSFHKDLVSGIFKDD